jgi:hypothetical protein
VRTRFAAIMTVLAMLAAACSSSNHAHKAPDPNPTQPTTSTAATSSPATGPLTTGPGVQPGEKPPILSNDAKQHTPAGALAFAAYYFKAFDWSVATNDPYLVRAISAPTCAACQRVISGLASLRSEGGVLRGGRMQLKSAKIVTGTFRFKADHVVEVSLNQDPEVITGPSSAPTTAAQATKDTSLVFVSWVGHGWQVQEVGAPS